MIYLVDSHHWIQAQRAQDLEPYLGGHRLLPMTPDEYAVLTPDKPPQVWVASWRMLLSDPWLETRLSPVSTIMSVTSHYNLGGGLKPSTCFSPGVIPEQAFHSALKTLGPYPCVTVNSQRLYDLLAPHRPVVLTPHGVNTAIFSPVPHTLHDPPVIGWVGKTKLAKNYRMLVEALQTAAKQTPIVFAPVEVSKQSHRIRSRAWMRDYYRRLDYYLCFSTHEGTPNPALEAAASGVPLITTRVGTMPELVREGENGWFVDPTVESLVDRLVTLRDVTPAQHATMRQRIRADIEAEWTWEQRSTPIRQLVEVMA